MSESIKCGCGLKNDKYCPKCSKVRMVILLKNGNDNLKLTRANGEQYNPVWYSFMKYNKYEIYRIADKMAANIRKHPEFSSAANILQFYINGQRQAYFKKITL